MLFFLSIHLFPLTSQTVHHLVFFPFSPHSSLLHNQGDLTQLIDHVCQTLKPSIQTTIKSFYSGYGFASKKWPGFSKCVTSFLQCKGVLRVQRALPPPWVPLSFVHPVTWGSHAGPSDTFGSQLYNSTFKFFQPWKWMASHFDDLFKHFVRSTGSCTHMIQNINVCCRCNFSCYAPKENNLYSREIQFLCKQ